MIISDGFGRFRKFPGSFRTVSPPQLPYPLTYLIHVLNPLRYRSGWLIPVLDHF